MYNTLVLCDWAKRFETECFMLWFLNFGFAVKQRLPSCFDYKPYQYCNMSHYFILFRSRQEKKKVQYNRIFSKLFLSSEKAFLSILIHFLVLEVMSGSIQVKINSCFLSLQTAMVEARNSHKFFGCSVAGFVQIFCLRKPQRKKRSDEIYCNTTKRFVSLFLNIKRHDQKRDKKYFLSYLFSQSHKTIKLMYYISKFKLDVRFSNKNIC